jgi:proteasome lid subunit RPN8/RPN11
MLKIAPKEYEALRRHGEETYPHECCGMLLGRMDGSVRVVTSIERCVNSADSPRTNCIIEPREMVRVHRTGRERGEHVVGFYHSHPDVPARWSPGDLAGSDWFGCSEVITSVENGKASITKSYELAGYDEDDKRFLDETIEVDSTEVPARGGVSEVS